MLGKKDLDFSTVHPKFTFNYFSVISLKICNNRLKVYTIYPSYDNKKPYMYNAYPNPKFIIIHFFGAVLIISLLAINIICVSAIQ